MTIPLRMNPVPRKATAPVHWARTSDRQVGPVGVGEGGEEPAGVDAAGDAEAERREDGHDTHGE
jgi:hypothetical protein